MPAVSPVAQSSARATRFEAFPFDAANRIEGDPAPRVHWLHVSAPGEPTYASGLWTARPSKFRWTFERNETAHILEGHTRVTVEGGPVMDLREGDLAFFAKGTRTVWEVREPLKKLFVDTP